VKVLFINDSSSSSNWGDRAAAVSLRAMIEQSGGRIVFTVTEEDLWHSTFGAPSSEPPAVQSEESSARNRAKLFVPPIVLHARRRVLRLDEAGAERLIPETWDDFERAAAKVGGERDYGWPELLQAMAEADLAVIHGASLHGNGILQRTDLFLAYLIKTRFLKPVVIVNHTADLGHPEFQRIAEHVYPLFDDVVYRDPISAERWASLCGGRFAADTAFWFEPTARDIWTPIAGRPTYFDVWPDSAAFDPSQPYVCLGGSSIFHDRKDWGSVVDGFARLIRHLQSVYPGTIVLTASAELDLHVFRPLAARFGLPLVGVVTPIQQAVDILGNADAYIGGRWHPSIFALRGGTPLLALSSQTFKMRALADLVMQPTSVTFDALDPGREAQAIGQQLSLALEEGTVLRQRLKTWASQMAENCWDNVAFLRRYSQEQRPPTPPGAL
jgi:polysaccharide pyruvyl transferase WcaK-like protein